jgi:hypothetical protein
LRFSLKPRHVEAHAIELRERTGRNREPERAKPAEHE